MFERMDIGMIKSDNNFDPDNNVKPDNDGQKADNGDDLSGLPVLRPKVAGIDLMCFQLLHQASEIHWVCRRKS